MRIAHIGNLANVAYNLSKHLRDEGYDIDLFIVAKDDKINTSSDPRLEDNMAGFPPWIRTLNTSRLSHFASMRKTFSKYDFLHAYTLSPIYLQFCKRPMISHATGTDMREYAFGKGPLPYL